jgi:prepilin signal peptidase PulO-like enzyme (type II secretory pathway)
MTYQYYRKEAFGMGDVILATIFGVWGGLFKCVMALYFGIILAAVIGLFLIGIRIKKRHESIPLGPFLIAGWAGIHLWPL